ncbi:hypothetical protein D3C75_1051150 [compost metagenome]
MRDVLATVLGPVVRIAPGSQSGTDADEQRGVHLELRPGLLGFDFAHLAGIELPETIKLDQGGSVSDRWCFLY